MGRQVLLKSVRHPGVSVVWEASLADSGDLILSGQDLGPAVQALFGDDDHEYWVVVDARYHQRLRSALIRAIGHDGAANDDLLDLLQTAVTDDIFDGASSFQQWARRNRIPTRFHSWI